MITIIYRKGKATVADMQEGTCRSVGYLRVTNIRNEAIKSVKKLKKISKAASPAAAVSGTESKKPLREGPFHIHLFHLLEDVDFVPPRRRSPDRSPAACPARSAPRDWPTPADRPSQDRRLAPRFRPDGGNRPSSETEAPWHTIFRRADPQRRGCPVHRGRRPRRPQRSACVRRP